MKTSLKTNTKKKIKDIAEEETTNPIIYLFGALIANNLQKQKYKFLLCKFLLLFYTQARR